MQVTRFIRFTSFMYMLLGWVPKSLILYLHKHNVKCVSLQVNVVTLSRVLEQSRVWERTGLADSWPTLSGGGGVRVTLFPPPYALPRTICTPSSLSSVSCHELFLFSYFLRPNRSVGCLLCPQCVNI